MCQLLVLEREEGNDPRKDQEIEERVDYPGVKVQIRQQRAAKRERPPQAKAAIDELSPEEIDADERDDPNDGIREPRSEFPNTEHPHRQRLNPHEERRLLGERLESNLHTPIITRDEHLARSFGEIDFVPVKKMQPSQPGDEAECRDGGNQRAVADG